MWKFAIRSRLYKLKADVTPPHNEASGPPILALGQRIRCNRPLIAVDYFRSTLNPFPRPDATNLVGAIRSLDGESKTTL